MKKSCMSSSVPPRRASYPPQPDATGLAPNPGSAAVPRRHHLDRRAAAIAEAAQGAPDNLLSTRAVAEWLGVSIQFLEIGRHRGYGPKFVRIEPARIRYRCADVLAWLEERTFASPSQAGTWSAMTRRRTRRSTTTEGSMRRKSP
jgi:hypothetical protein